MKSKHYFISALLIVVASGGLYWFYNKIKTPQSPNSANESQPYIASSTTNTDEPMTAPSMATPPINNV